jgi:hypothetical protein
MRSRLTSRRPALWWRPTKVGHVLAARACATDASRTRAACAFPMCLRRSLCGSPPCPPASRLTCVACANKLDRLLARDLRGPDEADRNRLPAVVRAIQKMYATLRISQHRARMTCRARLRQFPHASQPGFLRKREPAACRQQNRRGALRQRRTSMVIRSAPIAFIASRRSRRSPPSRMGAR